MKLSDYVMNFLFEKKISHIFGYQGGSVTHLIDSLHKVKGLTYVQNYHEQASSFCADAYARVSGGVGVAIATSGPGAMNLCTGLATAYMDSIPIVAITGQVAGGGPVVVFDEFGGGGIEEGELRIGDDAGEVERGGGKGGADGPDEHGGGAGAGQGEADGEARTERLQDGEVDETRRGGGRARRQVGGGGGQCTTQQQAGGKGRGGTDHGFENGGR